ncbi:MAG: hypothetical protein ACM335_00025 [Deltaproteobacteria bacterium]
MGRCGEASFRSRDDAKFPALLEKLGGSERCGVVCAMLLDKHPEDLSATVAAEPVGAVG